MKGRSQRQTFALITFIVWTLIALFDFTKTKIMILEGTLHFTDDYNQITLLVSPLIKFYVWFALGLLLYSLYYRIRKMSLGLQVVSFVGLGLITVCIHYAIGNILYNLYLHPPTELWGHFSSALKRLPSTIPMSSLNYATIILILRVLDLNKKYRQEHLKAAKLESELSKAQLDYLKMQLRPHFIFNSLNTIAMMVRKKSNKEAVEMISSMSDLLRATLNREETQLVKLSYELELLKKYLEIEQHRFKDRLQIIYDIDPKSHHILVPNLIMQPLVENAFKHGFDENLDTSEIVIQSRLDKGTLHLSIQNTGKLLKEGWTMKNNQGIGLKNTTSRLRNLYGGLAIFSIKNGSTCGVVVNISFPSNHK